MNVSTQWATALRQIIYSNDDSSQQEAQDCPATLPDNELNIVQLLNVSSTPHIIDSNTLLPQPSAFIAQPLDSSDQSNANVIYSEQSSENQEKPAEPESKPRSSRFGRILHL